MTVTRWKPADHLDGPEVVRAYLRTAIDDGDPHLIVAALADVADARRRYRKSASVGALAIGGLAAGSFALGALAIGAIAIGRLSIGRTRIHRLEVDELVVGRLRILEDAPPPERDGSAPSA